MTIEDIARICHNANRDYCMTIGDYSHKAWHNSPMWQRESMIHGILFHLDHPDAGPEGSHAEWMQHKLAYGWVLGDTKDAEKKTHPCLVPFEKLPVEQQVKDRMIVSIIHALRGQLD